MLSSLLVVVDLLPRLGSMLLQSFYGERLAEKERSRIYLGFIVYELLSVSLVLLLFFRSFTTFIDMVVSLGFLAAPAIAWLNHKVVFSGDLQASQQPSTLMRYWNLAAICLLLSVSATYVLIRMLTAF
jgi:hypothetical protein